MIGIVSFRYLDDFLLDVWKTGGFLRLLASLIGWFFISWSRIGQSWFYVACLVDWLGGEVCVALDAALVGMSCVEVSVLEVIAHNTLFFLVSRINIGVWVCSAYAKPCAQRIATYLPSVQYYFFSPVDALTCTWFSQNARLVILLVYMLPPWNSCILIGRQK